MVRRYGRLHVDDSDVSVGVAAVGYVTERGV